MLLNNQWISEKVREEIIKYLETKENGNITVQNLWDIAKAVLRGKFIAIQAYLGKQGKSQINNLNLHLKELEKEKHTKAKVSGRKEILKTKAGINKTETLETIENINATKSWSFEKTKNS